MVLNHGGKFCASASESVIIRFSRGSAMLILWAKASYFLKRAYISSSHTLNTQTLDKVGLRSR